MPANKHWPRWIMASISKHFTANIQGLPLYIEGQHRNSNLPKDQLELRVDGPYMTEVSRKYWRLYIEVSVLVTSLLDNTNYHRLQTNFGLVATAFTDIDAYKLGTGVDDTQEWFACLQLIQDDSRRERIQINNFGIIEASSQLQQGSIEGHYEAFIREE